MLNNYDLLTICKPVMQDDNYVIKFFDRWEKKKKIKVRWMKTDLFQALNRLVIIRFVNLRDIITND